MPFRSASARRLRTSFFRIAGSAREYRLDDICAAQLGRHRAAHLEQSRACYATRSCRVDSTALPVSFKALLASLPRGEPLSTAALQARGLSAFRASALARSGWLTHLARGVYMLPGDTLTRDGCLAFTSAARRRSPGGG
jgi:hypothetical protein